MADFTTRIIGSVFVPRDHVEFVDSLGARVAYVELKPAYRIVSGDPLDKRICAAKINMAELIEFTKAQIHAEYLRDWQPPETGRPN